MLVLVAALIAAPVMAGKPSDCTRIQDGVLTYSAGHYLAGEPLTIGYDIFGYNYQAHLFNGSYANAYLGRYGFPPYDGDDESYLAANPDAEYTWVWPYRDVCLNMKWNDAWLSNKDCDDDGALDRHYGFPGYIGSGAWLTNHQWGYNDDGTKWTYFVKIVAAPDDAYVVNFGTEEDPDLIWFTADDTEIGPVIWGSFAIIQQVINDKVTGDHGLYYRSPASAGFGFYQP
jgi:hypothetical protein